MDCLTALLVGFLAALVGLLAPSMLNMTAAKISVERGKYSGLQFAIGASLFVCIQASIAVFFAKYLVVNPVIIKKLKIVAVFILLFLAIFFFIQAKKNTLLEGKSKKGSPFFIGIMMSALNILGVPFYLTMATIAERNGWLQLKTPYSLFFVFGAVLGDLLIFSLYATFAFEMVKRVKFITKNFNYILSGGLVILTLTTLIDIIT